MDAWEAPGTVVVEEASAQFLGEWTRLVSRTNWDKGRIIVEWRAALASAGAPAQACTDEAWARRVGNVSGQHVGRLRRVHERFSDVGEQYPGLYWSHFQAALDWHDAEMWLEGAVQNGWSISQMRDQRWESLGAVEAERPKPDDVVAAEFDEDFTPAAEAMESSAADEDDDSGAFDSATEAAEEAPFGADDAAAGYADEVSSPDAQPADVRPFEHLPQLPDDLAEALESFKLAIVRHKLAGWSEVSPDSVLVALDGLKALTLAP